ncbi:uncharacterized protein MELLADRAFT_90437 [Melampsora larici-populina 98AG31]|uniref:RmlD-like substrate binding domain-containing protein n=1 Tax=Melampsora larici-populina (strain 98AG31 / pathotype 3-4-7) TaxID=747676 RepID=F4RWX8_MELLP|nr:uncharacterized protein MELLADRAFT_90437 [Melampsora larici-populina 98AG31]EGG03146.1 hypothetical protein MELLADRAFT_90437 [Melampsora larici-populina 98AG31]
MATEPIKITVTGGSGKIPTPYHANPPTEVRYQSIRERNCLYLSFRHPGLLGRAVVAHLKKQGHIVKGLAFSRATDELEKIDLRDTTAIEELIKNFKPNLLVHCAAERRPDVAEKDPEGTKQLNVDISKHLAELSKRYSFRLIYICTDYVFDGNAPEGGYDVNDKPNPTNLYGETKLAGEKAILDSGEKGQVLSLRVPVLYGKAERNDESAINILIDGVKKSSQGYSIKMDDWATRYPTLVDDVAKVISQLASFQKPYPPILHFSSQKMYTKYSIAVVFANLLNLPIDNLVRVSEGPKAGETIRPRDCRLSTKSIETLGIDVSTVSFEDWWKNEFQSKNYL